MKGNDPTRRQVLWGGASVALLGACRAPGDGSAWQLPERRGVQTIEHTWVPMRDGVRLSARLFLPEGAPRAPAPVVLEMHPYRKRDRSRPHDDAWGETLASRGIAYARVDVRGSGDSEGLLEDEYTGAELSDGEELIAWLAEQEWCSGAVGMRGLSWGGINTLQIAARRPPSLGAIVALGATDRRYTNDAHYIGGCLGRTNFQWGALLRAVMATPPDPEVVGESWEDMWRERLAATPPILARWLENSTENAYWQRGSVAFDPSAIAVPAYLVAGWQEPYATPILRLLRDLKVPKKGLVGPWGHEWPEQASPQSVDWASEEIRWWCHWLRDEPTGVMDEPQVQVFVADQAARRSWPDPIPGRWVSSRDWSESGTLTWTPREDGGLEPTIGEEAERAPAALEVPTEIVGLATQEWIDRLPEEQARDDATSLVFDSAELAEDVEILGGASFKARVRVDASHAHLAVRLCDVDTEGRSWLVTYGILNLCHRDSHELPSEVPIGEWIDVDIPLLDAGYRLLPSHRLRLAVSSSLWPLVWPPPGRPRVELDVARCVLELPDRRATVSTAQLPFEETLGAGTEPPPLTEPRDDGGVLTLESRVGPWTQSVTLDDVAEPTEITSELAERSGLQGGLGGASFWSQDVTLRYRRGAWDCTVEVGYRLSASAQDFELVEWTRGARGEEEIFEREYRSSVPRRFL